MILMTLHYERMIPVSLVKSQTLIWTQNERNKIFSLIVFSCNNNIHSSVTYGNAILDIFIRPNIILICPYCLYLSFFSSEVQEVGEVKRHSRGTGAAAPAPTPEPRGRHDLHRACAGALGQLGAGPAALHRLPSAHSFPFYDP